MDTKEAKAIIKRKHASILMYRQLVGYMTAILFIGAATLFVRTISEDKPYYSGKSTDQEAWLNEASLKYLKLAQQIENATYCMPLNVDIIKDVEIYFHSCPSKVLATRGLEHKVKDGYTVDKRIARRFHFWREVYSTWSSDQFVLHSSHYPEVVLEVVDVSHMQGNQTPNQRKKAADAVIRKRKKVYRNTLVKMHRMHRKGEPFTSPAMIRIERLVKHIKEKNKYWHIARGIRTQRGQRDFIAQGLQASGRYLPAIKKEFRDQGVPEDLANIAFIESSFNLHAYSKVGAGGIFQIMPATGKQYMIIDDLIDERKDPIKSATAAAKLLNLNHRLTKRWPLAITAYNHGVGGIKRAIKAVNSKEIVDLIEQYEGRAFGFASKNFYTGFLGLLDTLENKDKVFPSVLKYNELQFAEYKLPKQMRIADLKKKFSISNDIISFYNPDISRSAILNNAYLPKRYVLKFPKPHEDPDKQAADSAKENT